MGPLLPPFPSFPPLSLSLHYDLLPYPLLPSPPLPLQVGTLNPARGSGERCKLPQWGRNWIWCILLSLKIWHLVKSRLPFDQPCASRSQSGSDMSNCEMGLRLKLPKSMKSAEWRLNWRDNHNHDNFGLPKNCMGPTCWPGSEQAAAANQNRAWPVVSVSEKFVDTETCVIYLAREKYTVSYAYFTRWKK